MEFWIKQDNEALQLSVNPEDFNVTVTHRNTVVNVIKLGDINLIGKTGLREVSLSSFFPAQDYNFSINSERKEPIACVNLIEGFRNSGKPVRVIITDLLNMEATIEGFSWGEKDATGDIYYTIALKEYKKPKIKNKATAQPTTTRETKSPKSSSGKTYTVKKGDSLWSIAKRFYGNGAQYNKIYKANTKIIKNPNVIYAGQVLTIP